MQRVLASKNQRLLRRFFSLKRLKEDETRLTVKLPEDYFPTTMQSLQTWHDQTIDLIDTNYQRYKVWHVDTLSSIDKMYQSWRINEAKLLEIKNWEDYSSEDNALYVNTILYLFPFERYSKSNAKEWARNRRRMVAYS